MKAPVLNENFRKNQPEAGIAPIIAFGHPFEFKLANGIQGIVVENHHLPQINFQLYLDLGKIDQKDKAGITDLTGEMLSRGTTTMKKAEFDDAIDFMGAYFSTSSRGFTASGLSRYADELFSLASQAIKSPDFSASEFEIVKKQTFSGLEAQKENADSIGRNLIKTINFGPDHPQGQFITQSSLNNITIEDIRNFYNGVFDPAHAYLIIVGDLPAGKAVELAQQYFGDWKSKSYSKDSALSPTPISKTDVSIADRPSAVQSLIMISYPVDLKPNDPDLIKAKLMNDILGGYFSSRLNENLREKQGYTYGIRSNLVSDPEKGLFSIMTNVRNEVTDSAITQILIEMKRLREEKISNEELQNVKNVISGEFARSLEEPKVTARFALDILRYNLPVDYFKNYLRSIQKVTATDIQKMAVKYLQPEHSHIIVIGNQKEIEEKLKPFSSSGYINHYDFQGTPLNRISPENPNAAVEIIHKYLKKIGGVEEISKLKSLSREYNMNIDGVEFNGFNDILLPYQMRTLIKMGETEMQSTVLNQTGGYTTTNGEKKELAGIALSTLRESAVIIEELSYLQTGFKLTYKGIDTVNNKSLYKVEVVSPAGNQKIEYYDIDNFLKFKTVTVNEAGGEESIIYKEYKDFAGILFPVVTELIGQLDKPILIHYSVIRLNPTLKQEIFK